ncbi:ABC transporter substrate-binding protein [Jatrophihabitans sp. DSM 45814]
MNDIRSESPGRRRPIRRRLAVVAVASAVAVTLAACAHSDSSSGGSAGGSKTYSVGLIGSQTGAQAQIGQDSVNGAQLAADEINASGGLLGAKVSISAQDDAGLPSTGVSAAQKLTENGSRDALLGPDISSIVEAVSPTVTRAQIPWVVSAISPKDFQLGNKWIFGGRPTDSVNAQIMAQYATSTLKVTDTVVIYNTDAYAEPTLPFIKQYDAAAGLKVLSVEGIQDGATTAASQVETAIRSGAQSIEFWGLLPEAALTLKTAKSLGFHGQIFGANALVNQTTLQLAGAAANGATAATTFVSTNSAAQVQAFVKKYQAKYNSTPNDHASIYYDMMNLLAQAVKNANSFDADKVRSALASLQYEGVNGPIQFDSSGVDIAHSGVIAKVDSGQANVVQFLNTAK